MNEHIQKGNEALAREDLQTAKAEFKLAMCESDPTIQRIVQRIAKNQLEKIDRELSESKTTGGHIKTVGFCMFAPAGSETQNAPDRPEEGWLSYLGYHVGAGKGLPKNKRRDVLREAFYRTIPEQAQFTEAFVIWWGQASSQKRFQSLCNRLQSLIRSNINKPEMIEAVKDWREDFQWLESEFIKDVCGLVL